MKWEQIRLWGMAVSFRGHECLILHFDDVETGRASRHSSLSACPRRRGLTCPGNFLPAFAILIEGAAMAWADE